MSMSICRAHFDSMQENHMFIALGKEDGEKRGVCVLSLIHI